MRLQKAARKISGFHVSILVNSTQISTINYIYFSQKKNKHMEVDNPTCDYSMFLKIAFRKGFYKNYEESLAFIVFHLFLYLLSYI